MAFQILEREIVGRTFVDGGSGRGDGGGLRRGLLVGRLLISGLLRLGRSGTLVATLGFVRGRGPLTQSVGGVAERRYPGREVRAAKTVTD